MKNPSLNYNIGSIAIQKYNIPPKACTTFARLYEKYSTRGMSRDKYSTRLRLVQKHALPLLVCTKNTALEGMSGDKCSARLRLMHVGR